MITTYSFKIMLKWRYMDRHWLWYWSPAGSTTMIKFKFSKLIPNSEIRTWKNIKRNFSFNSQAQMSASILLEHRNQILSDRHTTRKKKKFKTSQRITKTESLFATHNLS
jgi:hypothetical protein